MTFANAPTTYFKAAYAAMADHVAYWIQVSGGRPGRPTALVTDGWWQADIQALVSYYATVPAGCGQCAPVTIWEPWNESNNTGWSNAPTTSPRCCSPSTTRSSRSSPARAPRSSADRRSSSRSAGGSS